MQTHIDITEYITPVQEAANAIIKMINDGVTQHCLSHRRVYHAFWDSAQTPDELLAAMTPAQRLEFATTAGASVGFVASFAGPKNRTVNDYLAPDFYVPRREIIVNAETGEVTLGPPAEGHDAWGRPILEPEPEIEAP